MCDHLDKAEKDTQKIKNNNENNRLLLKIQEDMQLLLKQREDISNISHRLTSLEEEFKWFGRKLKDLEEDRRTDLSIARATRKMKFFEKMPQELQGNAFTEDIKDYY